MAFREGEFLYILDDQGKRHWFKAAAGMVKVPSLGSLDGDRVMALDDGARLVVAKRPMHVFRPGTTDLMSSLERGAQVITPKDAATIIMECDIPAARTVLEVGAGSGSMSIALLRALPPEGRLHTIELRDDFAKRAERNIARAGLSPRWECSVGDARTVSLPIEADVAVMDMPTPWEALANVDGMLREGGRVCAYVPNTNQLESAVRALRELGYAEVRAVENLQRGMEVHAGGVRPSFEMLGHTAYLVFGRKAARGEE